jgi:predicted permease
MLAAVLSVLTIFLIIGVGYFLARREFFSPEAGEIFARTVVNVALPAMMVYELTTGFTRGELIHGSRGLFLQVLAYVACALLAPLAARLGGVASGRRGTFTAMFVASNTIFIGLPVNLALFGSASVPYVLLAYAVNTFYFWTWGIHGIESDGGNHFPLLSWDHLKRILAPPFLAFLVGIALVFSGLRLPIFLASSLKQLGAMTTPLSLVFMGITFASIALAEIKPTRDMMMLFLGRFLLAPGLVYAFYRLIPVPTLMVKVFMIQAAMPAITQSALAAKTSGGDYRYATVMVSATNLASLAVLPLYMALFSVLFPA